MTDAALSAPSAPSANRARPWVAHGLVTLALWAVYLPVVDFPFVVLDDKAYVSENPHVVGGLTRESVTWAFSESREGNYVPLSWISHMLDVEVFGLDAGGHHTTNVWLHWLASLLLLEALRRATGDLAPSAFVALVFAIHPLHVESVAWVAERRDVLSGAWFAAVLLAWVAWTRRGGAARYVLACAALVLGLLSKAMLVTLPCVLLLLDLWPLRRTGRGVVRLLAEKLPLLLVAGLAAGLAYATQSEGGVASLEALPLDLRAKNAAVAAVTYLGRTAWPLDLAVFYPYDFGTPLSQALFAGALLAAITGAALALARSRPWLTVGWLWYLGMLLPVVGLVQIGMQATADRYTYLPMIGLGIAAAWTGREIAARSAAGRRAVLAVAVTWLAFCGLAARAQVMTWQDSVTLFEHARAITGDNAVVHLNLGEAFHDAGDVDRALEGYKAGLRLHPNARQARTRLGTLLVERRRYAEGVPELEEAIRRHPEEPGARRELAAVLLEFGKVAEARALLEEELVIDPSNPRVRELLEAATATRAP